MTFDEFFKKWFKEKHGVDFRDEDIYWLKRDMEKFWVAGFEEGHNEGYEDGIREGLDFYT